MLIDRIRPDNPPILKITPKENDKDRFLQMSPMMCGVILEERISWFVGEIKPDTISLVGSVKGGPYKI